MVFESKGLPPMRELDGILVPDPGYVPSRTQLRGMWKRVKTNFKETLTPTDTATPIAPGSIQTEGQRRKALIVHPEFFSTDRPQFS